MRPDAQATEAVASQSCAKGILLTAENADKKAYANNEAKPMPEQPTTSGPIPPPHEAASEPLTRRQTRLLISIPALMVCLTLGTGVLCYQVFRTYEDQFLKHEQAYNASAQAAREPLYLAFEEAEMALLTTILFVIILAALAGYILARTIVHPLRSFAGRLEEIASTGRVAALAPDVSVAPEIGVLGQRFNQVLSSLQNYVTQRNRYILECFTGGLALIDVDGAVMTMNSAAEALLGPESRALTGASLEDWLRGIDAQSPLAEAIRAARREGRYAESRELELATPSQGRFPILVTISPLQDTGGERTGFAINFRDLRALKQFYEQMRRADHLAALGTFATGVAHEIRNPLGSVKGVAQLLSEELGKDEKARKYLEVIVREVNRLDKVVRSVLDYAQPNLNPPEIQNLNALLGDVVARAREAAAARNDRRPIEFIEEYGEVPLVRVQPEPMLQAFQNILRNAVEAVSPGGSIRVSTRLVEEKGQTMCEARITNSGPEIPHDAILHIFEPFFSTKPGGTGLGLAITSQIVHANGGQIRCSSGEGLTTFTVLLPAQSAETDGAVAKA